MAMDWFWKAMGTSPKKNQKKSRAVVAQASAERFAGVDDDALRAAAREAVRTSNGQPDYPALLAALREAVNRTLDVQPFDVQMEGTHRLLHGDIVEMATGEGKTLTGAMATVGYALRGQRVHVITVNSYLAGRDDAWMGPLFDFFGLSHGAIHEDLDADQRRDIYRRDVIFGAINEIGFDVLRDQLITRREDQVRTPADVAVIDEADSVMVDEALVPLVLAGSEPSPAPTSEITRMVKTMEEDEHFQISADHRNIYLTDTGASYAEKYLGVESLYGSEEHGGGDLLVQINVALHAEHLLARDVHYIVRDGKVALIDGSRGRVAELQRWPDGLQAAVEAKEGLDVTDGGRILDQITIQALVGMYPHKCGMTGTAIAASDQFRQFYDLKVSAIDPNVPTQRFDEADRIYATLEERDQAVIRHIIEVQKTGQPQLIGTQDVAESERLADALVLEGVESNVLNAKNHEAEAAIIAEAGRPGRVTVSTQMAGRGTDIKLGGMNEEERSVVVDAGGLHVVGVGRFRSTRLDNQLRGRAGRQGDPGSSVFFLSLEDDMIAAGGSDQELHATPDEDGLLAQKRVLQFVDHCQRVTEGQLLDIHATTWKYNKLIKDQRDIIAARRDDLLDTDAAWKHLSRVHGNKADELAERVDQEVLEQAAREIMLYHLDFEWSEHLAYLDDIRESIHLRAIARESPIDEFHRMSIAAFADLAERAVARAEETFAEVHIDADGAHLENLGLQKPSATWTYMVNDNPLSADGRSVRNSIARMFK
ncbi:accessory Sec system translocase SecA2 [Corynebacterium sp. zg254]|uniref:Protein translocase subunit SecA n=1 Tax=Corynebacterium zhongnanshanii TaxID=2768834 RepID=A0ABQ6VK88_9CORY|nr:MULTISPECIES: accessory Sec system translocase SecA2 [Corynebacterium]KAB3523551.1 accessory Sec system translocase SecA2 [Corynebacterium zhongnanshanii]MCR5913291.1 accessory Sec system translocase SecA2 [Corynebacterium sp. zg254]